MDVILKPTEKELEILTKVTEITGVDYDAKEWKQDITIESLLDALKDMVYEYHIKEEELEEKKEYCDEYHVCRDIDPYEEYGVSRKDFY